ncbi:hypothetical protein LCGC14_1445050, partial [marine sediment metagenome]|nr:sodium:proton antiporter [Methylophaga aminisulfidivorans]
MKPLTKHSRFIGWALLAIFLTPLSVFASEDVKMLDLTSHWVGYTAIVLFVLAYALVIAEEEIHMRKSKPVIVAAGVIWGLIAVVYAQQP